MIKPKGSSFSRFNAYHATEFDRAQIPDESFRSQNVNVSPLTLSLAGNAAREKLAQVSKLNPGEYSESEILIRYSGNSNWSRAGAKTIVQFLQRRLRQPLPIGSSRSARDRLQRDREEGRALIGFLRTNGIPLIALRSRVRGMSTDAHIHVGRPSPRTLKVKHSSTNPGASDKSAVHG